MFKLRNQKYWVKKIYRRVKNSLKEVDIAYVNELLPNLSITTYTHDYSIRTEHLVVNYYPHFSDRRIEILCRYVDGRIVSNKLLHVYDISSIPLLKEIYRQVCTLMDTVDAQVLKYNVQKDNEWKDLESSILCSMQGLDKDI